MRYIGNTPKMPKSGKIRGKKVQLTLKKVNPKPSLGIGLPDLQIHKVRNF